MVERSDNLLDLSQWPAGPSSPGRSGLPPRPAAGRTGSRLSPRGWAVVAVVLGSLLLVLPLGGCGAALTAWAAETRAMPSDVPPALDDNEAAQDAQGVSAARAALAAWRPAGSSATSAPRPASTSRQVTVRAADPKEVAAAQSAVDAAERDVGAAQRELDRLLAEQEAADDPGAYDGQVDAAREELDRAVARLDEEQRALAVARARTRTVIVTTTASPRPAASPAPSPAATDRAALVAALAEAQQVQKAHLAQRAQVVADWRASHEEQVGAVVAHNARVRSCAGRSVLPAGLGTGLVVAGGGFLLRRRLGGWLGR